MRFRDANELRTRLGHVPYSHARRFNQPEWN